MVSTTGVPGTEDAETVRSNSFHCSGVQIRSVNLGFKGYGSVSLLCLLQTIFSQSAGSVNKGKEATAPAAYDPDGKNCFWFYLSSIRSEAAPSPSHHL